MGGGEMPRKLNNINPLVDNFYSRRLGESNKVKRKKKDQESNSRKKRDYDEVVISDLGKLLTSIKEELKNCGTKKAISGFNSIMELIGHPPSNLVTVNFVDLSAALSEQNSTDFIRLFEIADLLEERNYNLQKWINSFVNLSPDQLGHHLDITNFFLETDNSQDFNSYVDTINNLVLNQDLERDVKLQKLEKLFNSLKQLKSPKRDEKLSLNLIKHNNW